MESHKRLYTEKQISISAVIAGPIAPGILIYKNLHRLNKEKQAYISIAATLIFTVLLVYGLLAIPDEVFDKVPSQLAPSLIGIIFWVLYHYVLADSVKKEFDLGCQKESNWRVAGVTLIGMIIYLAIALGVGFTLPPFPGEKITFKGNDVYFDEHTSEADVEKLANLLFDMEYFSEDYPNVVRLETKASEYVVILPIGKDFWTNEEITSELTSLKWFLELEFAKKVTLTLEDYQLNGKRITKSI
ncbi:hypothetical protein [Marinoscillum sp.]|uniref:hypothetical protein n=1 Tax=Marinoscillum sp. TaxID=2024838 RepID=UPI003BA9BE8F